MEPLDERALLAVWLVDQTMDSELDVGAATPAKKRSLNRSKIRPRRRNDFRDLAATLSQGEQSFDFDVDEPFDALFVEWLPKGGVKSVVEMSAATFRRGSNKNGFSTFIFLQRAGS